MRVSENIMPIFALAIMAATGIPSLVGDASVAPLKPETLDSVLERNGEYFLANNTFEADEAGRIFIESEAQGCFEGNLNYKKDEAASLGAAVDNLTGKYNIKTRESGKYGLWCRANAPAAGTWSFFLKMAKTDSAGTDVPEEDVPKGWNTASAFDEAGKNSIAENGAFVPSNTQTGKYVYIQGCVLELNKGSYILELQVPGPIRMDQIILAREPASEPEKSFAGKNGKPIAGRQIQAFAGSVTFKKAVPMNLGRYLRFQSNDKAGNGTVKWFWRMVGSDSQRWNELAQDRDLSKLTGTNAVDNPPVLKFMVKLQAGTNGPSPTTAAPAVEYQADPGALIVLKTQGASMHVSRISGHWGMMAESGRGVPVRTDENATLPFFFEARNAKGTDVLKIDQELFAVKNVQTNATKDGWIINADYEGAGIEIKFQGEWRGGDAITWTAEIENKSGLILESFHFPVLNGIQCGSDYKDDNVAWLGYLRKPAATLEDWLRSNPGQLTFFDLYDESAALYVGVHDPSMLDGKFNMRPFGQGGPYDFDVERYPEIGPGEKWKSPKYVIAVHPGDWHYAADTFYRPWYQAEMPKVNNPRWLTEDFTGFFQFIPYSHNPLTMTAAWRMGCFYGWQFSKLFLCDNPGPDFLPEFGGNESVARNAGWINAHGGQADSYTDVYGASLWHCSEFALRRTRPAAAFRDLPQPTLEWRLKNRELPLKAVGAPLQLKASPDWTYWPRVPYDYHFCLATEEVHDYWQSIAEYYARAGMNIYWDESGNTRNFKCYSPLHKHIKQGLGWSTYGRYACAVRMLEKGRRIKKDFILTGENYNDRVMAAVNINLLQDNGKVPFWDEVVRYTHSEHIYNTVIIKLPALVERAFLFHARISSSDIFGGPGATAWLRARMLLAQSVKDVSYKGRYLDNTGLKIEGTNIDARWAVLKEKDLALAAVNIVNGNESGEGAVTLELNDFPPVKTAFAYTLEGKVRKLDFNFRDGRASFKVPRERLSSVLLCGDVNNDNSLRVSAMMPMLEPAPAKLRVSLANLSAREKKGVISFGNDAASLIDGSLKMPFQLAGGGAETVEFPLKDRHLLQDFTNLEFKVSSGDSEKSNSVIVAPTLPDGSMELGVAGNMNADYWKNGLRDFVEPYEGKYLLAVPPTTGKDKSKCPYAYPENYIYLLPETSYTLKFNYRYGGSKPVHVAVHMWDENNKSLETKRITFNGCADFSWKEASLEFATPPGTSKSNIIIANMDDSGNGVNAWIDNVVLVELGATASSELKKSLK